MRYYKLIEANTNKLIAIGTNCGGTEITEAEYNELLSIIHTKADLVNRVYNGEITIDAVPEEWREEIQRRVDERIAADAEAEANAEDYEAALREMGVEV